MIFIQYKQYILPPNSKPTHLLIHSLMGIAGCSTQWR